MTVNQSVHYLDHRAPIDLIYIEMSQGNAQRLPITTSNKMTNYLPEVFAIDPKDGKTKFRFDRNN